MAAGFGVGGFQPSALSQAPVKLVVITHPGVGESHLDIDALRAVFLRRRLVWSAGLHIVAINQPNGTPVRVTFDRTVLGFSQEQVARFWIDARIRSGMQAPRMIAGDAMIANVVRQLPGAISYMAAETLGVGVRVVARIDAGRVLPP
jgi:hypothetical protein